MVVDAALVHRRRAQPHEQQPLPPSASQWGFSWFWRGSRFRGFRYSQGLQVSVWDSSWPERIRGEKQSSSPSRQQSHPIQPFVLTPKVSCQATSLLDRMPLVGDVPRCGVSCSESHERFVYIGRNHKDLRFLACLDDFREQVVGFLPEVGPVEPYVPEEWQRFSPCIGDSDQRVGLTSDVFRAEHPNSGHRCIDAPLVPFPVMQDEEQRDCANDRCNPGRHFT